MPDSTSPLPQTGFGQMDLGLMDTRPQRVTLSPGATLLRGFALAEAEILWRALTPIVTAAPLRRMLTPGGHQMSVAMTSCGTWGWVTDQTGYRYTHTNPTTQALWPAMPLQFSQLASRSAEAAGFKDFHPNACLINRYEAGARMTPHQDKDEGDVTQPIVSVSLGLPILFLWGGLHRTTRPHSVLLEHGDVLVWGGKARLHYHGVKPLAAGRHSLTGPTRFNLTFRHVAQTPS